MLSAVNSGMIETALWDFSGHKPIRFAMWCLTLNCESRKSPLPVFQMHMKLEHLCICDIFIEFPTKNPNNVRLVLSCRKLLSEKAETLITQW